MSWQELPERVFDREELRLLVESCAGQPELWRRHLAFPSQRRHYVSLHRDQYVDVWLLCWTRESDTGWHDHDVSAGAVRVVRGAVSEGVLRIGGRHRTRVVRAGGSFSFGPDHIHRLAGVEDGAVTIHAYSPPLWRLGQYTIGPDGLMRRLSVSYADELRPLDRAAVG